MIERVIKIHQPNNLSYNLDLAELAANCQDGLIAIVVALLSSGESNLTFIELPLPASNV